MRYVEPEFKGKAFTCPHCDVFAKQTLYEGAKASLSHSKQIRASNPSIRYSGLAKYLNLSFCDSCENYSIWYERKIVYPKSSPAPLPYDDMPEDVKEDYLEARNIVTESPRGAAALLRLSLQKLMLHLGEKGKDLMRI